MTIHICSGDNCSCDDITSICMHIGYVPRRVSSRPEHQPDASWQFRRFAFSRSKRIKLVPEPRIFTLHRELVPEPGPIFHFAMAHNKKFGVSITISVKLNPPPPPKKKKKKKKKTMYTNTHKGEMILCTWSHFQTTKIFQDAKFSLEIQWNLVIKRSDITKPSYNKVILLVPALYISLFFYPDKWETC